MLMIWMIHVTSLILFMEQLIPLPMTSCWADPKAVDIDCICQKIKLYNWRRIVGAAPLNAYPDCNAYCSCLQISWWVALDVQWHMCSV
jgi:hypothetical protein